MPVNYSELQYPCSHPGCKQFFKTTAGQTKHLCIVHMSLPQPSPSPSVLPAPPHESESDLGDDTNEGQLYNNNEWDQESFGDPNEDSGSAWPPSDTLDVDAQFYGPGNKLYRNYHRQLNGTCLDIFSVFGALTCCSCAMRRAQKLSSSRCQPQTESLEPE